MDQNNRDERKWKVKRRRKKRTNASLVPGQQPVNRVPAKEQFTEDSNVIRRP